MESRPITAPPELIGPSYNIYRYTDQIYKVVHFKSTAPRVGRVDKSKDVHHENKLDASLSRSRRVVLELALCNDWEWFCTFTLSGAKYDRKDLEGWYKRFTQWIRDQRKKYGADLKYVLVPEQHKDGSWHMHGLFSCVGDFLVSFQKLRSQGEKIPDKLVKGGYYNWPDYQKKFGYCSFGPVKNRVAVGFYVTKYITKSLQESCIGVGFHLYYASQGLNRATLHGDVYGECSSLDKFLVNHYDFCSTGMTHTKDRLDWSFGMEFMDWSMMDAFGFEEMDEVTVQEFEEYFEAVQQVIDGFN